MLRRSRWAVLLAVAAVYAPGLRGVFLNWDDNKIGLDPMLTQPFGEAVVTAFITPYDRAWYPLLRIVFRGLAEVSALTPWAVHSLDLALFVAVAAGIGVLLVRFGANEGVATLTVALWALHPLRVESVAWVSATKDVLSLALVVAAVLVVWPAAGSAGRGRTLGGLVLWGAALLVKSAVFPLAAVLWGVAWARFDAREATRRFGGFIALGLIDGVAARWAFTMGDVPDWPDGIAVWALAPYSYGVWAWRWVWPVELSAVVPIPDNPWPWVVLGAGTVVGTGALAGWRMAAAGDRWPAVLWAVWVLPMLPVAGLVPLQFWAADRYPLVASLAPTFLVALGLMGLASRHRLLPWAVGGILAGVLAVGSVRRVGDWSDSLTLWTTDLSRPGTHFARHVNLASAYGGLGRFPEALVEYQRAEALAPDRTDVLAHRLFAEVVVGGWDKRRAAVGMTLEPPPDTGHDWARAIKALIDIGELGLARDALRGARATSVPAQVLAELEAAAAER